MKTHITDNENKMQEEFRKVLQNTFDKGDAPRLYRHFGGSKEYVWRRENCGRYKGIMWKIFWEKQTKNGVIKMVNFEKLDQAFNEMRVSSGRERGQNWKP